MKKLLLLLVAFATISLTAQVTVFEDDFETEIVDATTYAKWTVSDEDGDTENFEVADFTAAFDATSHPMLLTGLGLDSDSWESGNANSPMNVNNYITTTDPIDLTGASGTITLSFLLGSYQVTGAFIADQYSVYMTTTNVAADIETETPVYNGTLADMMAADQADGSASAVTQSIDLSGLAGGGSYYLTFRHHDTFDENSVLFDNVLLVADAVAAVDDNVLSSSVNIYPTAVDTEFTINNRSTIALNTASVYDVNGRLISQHNLNGLVGEKSINVASLNAGLYFVELTSDNGKAIKKMIKK